jgi:hypothetical protein
MFRQYAPIITGAALFFAFSALAHANPLGYVTALQQDFDNISGLTSQGWAITNNSVPPSVSSWFQGNTGVFTSQTGGADSYIGANYLNTTPGGNISDWLILPALLLRNGDILTFYTRTEANSTFADNLEVHLSSNGASANVGSTSSSVGDFTNLLMTINPALVAAAYPDAWTQETVTISGLGNTPVDARLAFRYAVTDTMIHGDYIGIDTLTVSVQEAAPEPSTIALLLIGLGSLSRWARRFRRPALFPFTVCGASTMRSR